MSYTPTTWANGDIITATKLNNIESGVQSVSSSYTPTTWVNGDIITATKLNNIEQGIANAGGGGSSDFSTAQVTIVNNTNSEVDVSCVRLYEVNEYDDGFPALVAAATIFVSPEETSTFSAPLYKGTSFLNLNGASSVTITGSATLVVEGEPNEVFITGDCTITIS